MRERKTSRKLKAHFKFNVILPFCTLKHNVNVGEFRCFGTVPLVKERQIKIDNAHCLPCTNFQWCGYEV